MTRVFLAAGVAALAISAPALAGPHGGGGRDRQAANFGGGEQRAQRTSPRGGDAPRVQRQSFAQPRMQQRSFSQPRVQQRQFAAIERPQHAQRSQPVERARPMHNDRAQQRTAMRQQARPAHQQAQQRVAARQPTHVSREQAQNRQQVRTNRVEQAQNRGAMRQQMQASRMNAVDNRVAMRQQMQSERMNRAQDKMPMRQDLRGQGQASTQNLLADRRGLRADRIANADAFRTSRLNAFIGTPRTRVIAPAEAVRFVGQPVNNVTNFVTMSALPASVSYLYPATSNYYYQYGGGYLYQVDQGTNLIAALIPLVAGGYLPGTYLPSAYMNSYVPSYYGLNSFYPASYSYGGYGYGGGYGYDSGYPGYGYGSNVCNRYAYGVVYQVDCVTGMVINVVPTYAGGYGVGQMIPSAYSYYNVPMQYRSMYYPTADYSYWYAPGAIYQYDTSSSLITSVAALMSPGFTVGQPMPTGYSMYNVPMAYRSTYYDTPNAWYRYNNGYIYQVDPASMMVTSVVASLLS